MFARHGLHYFQGRLVILQQPAFAIVPLESTLGYEAIEITSFCSDRAREECMVWHMLFVVYTSLEGPRRESVQIARMHGS